LLPAKGSGRRWMAVADRQWWRLAGDGCKEGQATMKNKKKILFSRTRNDFFLLFIFIPNFFFGHFFIMKTRKINLHY